MIRKIKRLEAVKANYKKNPEKKRKYMAKWNAKNRSEYTKNYIRKDKK